MSGALISKVFCKKSEKKKVYHFVTHVYCSLSFLHVSRRTNCTNKKQVCIQSRHENQGIAYGIKQISTIGIYFKAAIKEL